MALTSISVVGQPSVVYFRRIQPSSRYQPVSPCSANLPGMSASLYVCSFDMAVFLHSCRCPVPQNVQTDSQDPSRVQHREHQRVVLLPEYTSPHVSSCT